ncbi:hypothetical protein K9L97_05335 [Candidatus Woesearchaeota archaeon]|nr:hypothetical protein [Candidatus Woesearchaeota archaeon]
MSILNKLKEYVNKIDQTITGVSQDIKLAINDYDTVLTTTYGEINTCKKQFEDVQKMTVEEFIKNGLYELNSIKETAKESITKSYDSTKKIVDQFIHKQKKRFQKKETIEDIIKKETKTSITYAENKMLEQPKPHNYEFKLNKNYQTNIQNIKQNYSNNITTLADTLLGKDQKGKRTLWNWEKRKQKLEALLKNTNYETQDKKALQEIKQTLQNNKYLKKQHSNLYETITNKIEEAILNA